MCRGRGASHIDVCQRHPGPLHREVSGNLAAEALRGTRAVSDEEYDSRSKAVREAESALVSAKASESAAQINLDYTRIKAPISGRISRRMVTPGNLVQPATILTTLVTTAPIYCYFDADESAFLNYRKNSGGVIPCELSAGGDGGVACQGRVDFFDNQVDEKTGTIRVRAVFDNADHALVPGLFAKVRVPSGPATEVLLIPDTVILSDQGRKFVMVVNATNAVEMRPVVPDRAHGKMRAIRSGLTEQDRIIMNGMMMMMPRPGMKVEIAPAPAATEGQPQEKKANIERPTSNVQRSTSETRFAQGQDRSTLDVERSMLNVRLCSPAA